jgi:hypothetical protein
MSTNIDTTATSSTTMDFSVSDEILQFGQNEMKPTFDHIGNN